jgi:hypothetical protein
MSGSNPTVVLEVGSSFILRCNIERGEPALLGPLEVAATEDGVRSGFRNVVGVLSGDDGQWPKFQS